MMRAYFHALADELTGQVGGGEILTCAFYGEDSDFVRLNRSRVRQAGGVRHFTLRLELIDGARHAAASSGLQGDPEADLPPLRGILETLRATLPHLPEDPHLNPATQVHYSERLHTNTLPASGAAIDAVIASAQGLDLAGIWASGAQYSGFANSLGQRNWHSSASFNLDWSCYQDRDKAVKANYAGFSWDLEALATKMDEVRRALTAMERAPISLSPGRYRAYLAPEALRDILAMMAWGGFGLKSHRTAQTPLLKMVRDGRRLAPAVNLREDSARGLAPGFTGDGHVKPPSVSLIRDGAYQDCLAGPRSAREFAVPVNSGDGEAPQSLDMAGGDLAASEVMRELGTGLWINNLWYCNFSDRNDCRITGMTRFACFWVENGAISAPINPMRFDDSVYRMLGENLLGLTRERTLLLDPGTYERRSSESHRLPGALIEGLNLTL